MAHGYTIDDQMVIRDPGKFEGEMYYVPDFWQRGLEGFSDNDTGGVFFFVLGDEDKAPWPELKDVYGLALEESDTGFVSAATFATKESYDKFVAIQEKRTAREEEEES